MPCGASQGVLERLYVLLGHVQFCSNGWTTSRLTRAKTAIINSSTHQLINSSTPQPYRLDLRSQLSGISGAIHPDPPRAVRSLELSEDGEEACPDEGRAGPSRPSGRISQAINKVVPRLTTIDFDGWELDDGEVAHAESPQTYWIPPLDAREAVGVGDVVNLRFYIRVRDETGEEADHGERMWVTTVEGGVEIGGGVVWPISQRALTTSGRDSRCGFSRAT